MTTISEFPPAKAGSGISARLRRVGAMLRRFGAAWMRGLHEQRRREAAGIIAHERWLSGSRGGSAGNTDARPKVVALRKSPATQPSHEAGPS